MHREGHRSTRWPQTHGGGRAARVQASLPLTLWDAPGSKHPLGPVHTACQSVGSLVLRKDSRHQGPHGARRGCGPRPRPPPIRQRL